MGISYLAARMMWDARQRGVSFDRVLTLGHQSLRLFPSEVEFFRSAYRQAFGSPTETFARRRRCDDYVDDFLREFLGTTSLTVLDNSSFEGADTIHDMNVPVPASWHGAYDVVIDGGSLEHIFNVPTAFANLGHMVKVGGTVFINTPANNMMGHGFYQFSPELMFRIFNEDNGFTVDKVLLYEARYPGLDLTRKDTVFEVIDPAVAGRRVGLQNDKPVMMMVEATKVRDVTMFRNPPQQSDYVAMWNGEGDGGSPVPWQEQLKRTMRRLPVSVRAPLQGRHQKRVFSLANRQLYTRERWLPGRTR